MSKSRLEEMSEVLAEMKPGGKTLDQLIAEAEHRLSLLRGIRQATKTEPGKPRTKKDAVAGKVV